jgi:hypothetical protein
MELFAGVLAALVAGILQAPVVNTKMKRFSRAVIVVIATLLVGVIVFLFFQWTAEPAAPELHITNPISAATVPRYLMVEGTSNLPAGAHVWVSVQFENRYYPQGMALTDSSGKWSQSVSVGNDKTAPGTTFEIVATAGTGTGGQGLDEVFDAYVQVCTDVKSFPGLTSIPSLSGMAVQRVTVRGA